MGESGKDPDTRAAGVGGVIASGRPGVFARVDDSRPTDHRSGSEAHSASGARSDQSGSPGNEADVYRQTLDTVADAVFHLDGDKRVVWLNNAASALGRSVARFRVGPGQRLQTGDPAFDARVADICRGRDPRHLPFVIDARNDAGTLLVGHVRSSDGHGSVGNEVAAILIVHAAARGGDWGDLVAHFGLTAAEVALTHDLITGMTLDDVALRRGTSIHTVRNQLRSILAKTGTNRQSELVGLLAPFAAQRSPGGRAEP